MPITESMEIIDEDDEVLVVSDNEEVDEKGDDLDKEDEEGDEIVD